MSSTEIKPGNLYGYNVSLNNALEKAKLAPRFEILGSQATSTILKDLNLIEDKLNYLKLLADNNSATIPEMQAKIQTAIINGLINQALDAKSNYSLVNLKLDDKPLITQEDIDRISELPNKEHQLIELEHTFYTNFHAAPGSLNEKLDKLFSVFTNETSKEDFRKAVIKSDDSTLTEDFERMELADWYRHVHYMLASNSHNFYKDYENNVKKELSLSDPKQQKVPFYTQLLALRQIDAYINSKEITGHIVSFLQGDIETSANVDPKATVEERASKVREVIKSIEKLPMFNLISVRGSGGTGKSSVLANWTLRSIIDQNKLGDVIDI